MCMQDYQANVSLRLIIIQGTLFLWRYLFALTTIHSCVALGFLPALSRFTNRLALNLCFLYRLFLHRSGSARLGCSIGHLWFCRISGLSDYRASGLSLLAFEKTLVKVACANLPFLLLLSLRFRSLRSSGCWRLLCCSLIHFRLLLPPYRDVSTT